VTATVILTAGDPVVHLPVAEHRLLTLHTGPTVVRTVCGLTGIGPVKDRPDYTCAVCMAASGRRPGKKGKQYLRRLTKEAQRR
jgi:hypothetical protein